MAGKSPEDDSTEPDPSECRKPVPVVPDHELLRCIGSGSYGEVWLARNVMGTYRAVKIVYRQTFANERPYDREFSGIKKFEPVSRTHSGLVDILQIGRNDAAGYYYHVMELCDDVVSGQQIDPNNYVARTLGADLSNRGILPCEECLQLGLGLAAALAHLHKNGLIHRDIKPSNIIFVNGIPKIADIGLVADVGATRSFVGTEGFIPPEGPGTVQADIYSLGKVLYEASTGHDRQSFPELPTRLDEFPNQKEYLEFNEVILRACESDIHRRYRSADAMHSDLLLLRAGKSIKRLRLLEQRWGQVKRIALLATASLAVAAVVVYQVIRENRFAAERRQQQVGQNVARGTQAVDEGDLLGALPPLVEALGLESNDPQAAKTHRIRIASVLEQCPRLVRMWFPTGMLNNAEFSTDGRWMVTAGKNGEAAIWDVNQDDLAPIPIEGKEELESASFSNDGRRLLTSGTNFVWLRTLGAKTPPLRLEHPAGVSVYSARFSPDDTLIVTASGNDNEGHVWIWDAASGHLLRKLLDRFEYKKAAFRFATFSPDGRRILTAGEDNTAQVWDLASGERVGQPIRHKDWVYRASYSKDGRFIVTASQDTSTQLCDAETGRQVLPPWKHLSPVRSAEFSPDGRHVVTACGDFTARIWNVATGELLNPPLRQSGQQVVYAAFSPDGRCILTANANGVVCLWDLARNNRLPHASRLTASTDGERLATINGNEVTVWNTTTNSVVVKIEVAGELLAARLNRDGSRLAAIFIETNSSGGAVTNAQVWNGLTGAKISPAFPIRTEIKHPFPMVAPDGQRLVTLDGADVRIWDASQGKPLFLFRHDSMVVGASFSPDSNWLVIWGGTNAVVWETATGRRGHTLPHPDEVNHAEFSPDSLLLVTSCNSPGTWYERDAQIWSVATGNKVGPPLHHGDGVLHASFSPDGKRIVTGSEDGTVRVWELGTGRQLWYRDLHAQVSDASFSQDGRWIVTACEDHTARVWDAETGEPITPPLKRPEPFFFANFIANGLGIVSLTSKGSAVKWELTRDEHPIDDLRLMARLLSGHQSGSLNGASSQATGSLQEVWHKLRTKYLAEFETPPQEILVWHQHEAAASEEDKNWPAAIFHWNKLIELQPTDAQFRERRALAQAALDDWSRSTSGY